MHCCEKCQVYWTCETKWYRGEKGEENICCPVCSYYGICLEEYEKADKKGIRNITAAKIDKKNYSDRGKCFEQNV